MDSQTVISSSSNDDDRLGDELIETHVLARFCEAGHVLVPHDAMATELHDMKPVCSAVFIIENPDRDSGNYRLEVELKEVESRESQSEESEVRESELEESKKCYETVLRRWSKLEANGDELPPLMEVDIVDLEGSVNTEIISSNVPVVATPLATES